MTRIAALASRTISPAVIDATIDRYAVACCARIDRLVAQAALPEPVAKDVDRAVKAIKPLIETLMGLAIGRAIGAVMQGVRRTFEPAVSARVETALGTALRTIGPPERAQLFALDSSPCRTLGGEVKQRLRRRIALAAKDVCKVLTALGRELEPHEQAAFVRMLGLLVEDPMLGDRLAPQIEIGWRCYVAVVEGATGEPGDGMWARWLRKVRGEQETVLTTSEKLASAGFVMQIA
jgi:hypothetical protein